eukprot:CAMPEP_0183352518 /NCGR_PEP_ID=MMETSP0164_2-20130417/29489_1 /TAXON_ID=221442 /ORGANISM="Coccolithus pelagicus ssp braarudi, Strain PLY182g" /LENGTH=166 /DNA_ID=CAMNT_0025524967 /DNA_START=122 /DNA_END=622 /DNA_ORIENTATION=+
MHFSSDSVAAPAQPAQSQSCSGSLPKYCCAILSSADGDDSLLVELRDPKAAAAAGKLTCFGGKREADEPPLACVLRELAEELGGWQPERMPTRSIDLYVHDELIAWFYDAQGPGRDVPIDYEPGREGIWIAEADLLRDPRLSEWHEVVLQARRNGELRADFPPRVL